MGGETEVEPSEFLEWRSWESEETKMARVHRNGAAEESQTWRALGIHVGSSPGVHRGPAQVVSWTPIRMPQLKHQLTLGTYSEPEAPPAGRLEGRGLVPASQTENLNSWEHCSGPIKQIFKKQEPRGSSSVQVIWLGTKLKNICRNTKLSGIRI